MVPSWNGHGPIGAGQERRGLHRGWVGRMCTTAQHLPDGLPLQANAELAVRDMLRAFGAARQAQGLPLEVSAEDHLDDGSPIRLCVQIDLSQVQLLARLGRV